MFEIRQIDRSSAASLIAKPESQFLDYKRRDSFEKVAKTATALANADGGELLVGIADAAENGDRWLGYPSVEDANGHATELLSLFRSGPEYISIDFIQREDGPYVLRATIQKTPFVVTSSDEKVYKRVNAQDREVKDSELRQLELDKGVRSFEDSGSDLSFDDVKDSNILKLFVDSIVPNSPVDDFFKRERLLTGDRVRVAGVILFDDLPQASLAQSAVKIYRYKTLEDEGSREELDFDPVTIEGPAYDLVMESVAKTKEIIEGIPIMRSTGFKKIKYPQEAIHEVICNAIIHRDYSINDYVHIRIFDNRVEVESPGKLAGPVTVKNILNQRFARNKRIVRLLNKFPSPPNKDVGEGLNTATKTMVALNLGRPEIKETEASVLVILRHEPLASKEEIIVEYIKKNGYINNSAARKACSVQSDSVIRKLFKQMIEANVIEKKPGTRGKGTKYQLPTS